MIGLNVWLFVCICVLSFSLGFLAGFLWEKRRVTVALGFLFGAFAKKKDNP